MKIARINDSKFQETYALVSDDGKHLVTRQEIQEQTGIPVPPSIKDFMFNGWLDEVRKAKDRLTYKHRVEEAELLVPIPNPPKIVCLAFNYYDHARDAGLTPSDEPVIFLKPRTALNKPYGEVHCPSFVTRLDYEAELAVVIGKQAKKLSEEDALDCVFGYMIFHDVSARDIQFKDKQFTRGKGIDTFAPCGPWITTKDEVPDPQNLMITTKVNSETRQNSSSSNMVLSIRRIISGLTRTMTLEPGDIISTGTPAGVAMSMKEPRYLKNGDVVEIAIERLGVIRHKIIFQ
ncbi:2-keto-4-pentenoate hydratase/2-oxohepta-3-ene-1,7-dioic acid hydratase [Candidatus Nitrososphaera evergladensis SR1]|jgi:2-keto-4-pentenoate hydratase/2-oxohepta-3-ene-1,7-dioic acid hydratase in catechol pathway|uniref:2-keto-4-pentenoate hydratase/2-oxohepta-3-ene-1,7-dioic acid hydratase n=1 Tax=Candidatus Nitrososphaera evergladensis SR1 TaxID=1459636 RepID=A0A075MS28_9ARCH|nr:fumarylacetoacetate hydrolase family protein [Candidatus Nitrososphaera evergladensis]AIF84321.1 2-keto-4-pentenoate hydratase/2-oxohepta-3-ene-1,7-dioic acid hydratase [Candidatus Nitrososphaera evergladensis SR1]